MHGLDHAIALASAQHARLRVLNVLDDSLLVLAAYAYPTSDVHEVEDSLWADGRKLLDRAVALARRHGIEAEPVQLRAGLHAVSDVILEDARSWNADLIVMGTHGRRGVKRLMLGSEAAGVLSETQVPILLVKAAASRVRRRKTAPRKRPRKAAA